MNVMTLRFDIRLDQLRILVKRRTEMLPQKNIADANTIEEVKLKLNDPIFAIFISYELIEKVKN